MFENIFFSSFVTAKKISQSVFLGNPLEHSLTFATKATVNTFCDEERQSENIDTCGLYYKHVTIVNYTSSIINKLKASLNDDARVVIYDRHMATGGNVLQLNLLRL